ncbi:MAG: hypothetical protein ACH37Z_18620 [Anaerolineae bacterium]
MSYGRTPEEERAWSEQERQQSARFYNTTSFPILVAHHGSWDIYRNDKGYCAAIPTEYGAGIGCRASHFGDMAYLRSVPNLEYVKQPTELKGA